MILSDRKILSEIENNNIIIHPFNPAALGSNSYDVTLGKWLGIYDNDVLNAKTHNKISYLEIGEGGHLLLPSILYLGVTSEYTETHSHVPFLEGKSSTGRLGINIHATAGKGDVGFCGHWTLEISVIHPVRVYAGMPIGQLIYFAIDGEVNTKYNQKNSAKYRNQQARPVESMMFKNFTNE